MFTRVTISLLQGFGQNLIIFFITLIVALPLGLLITWGRMSKIRPLSLASGGLIWIIRGTPLMLQLFIVFYVPGLVFGMPFHSRMLAALIAFSINYAAYFAEIYRGAIENIPKGQWEAGHVLGLTKKQVFFNIILFQIFKRITAPIGNEIITLVKDTALARVIAVPEILMNASNFTAQGLVWPLFYTGAFFLAMAAAITWVFGRIERRIAYATG